MSINDVISPKITTSLPGPKCQELIKRKILSFTPTSPGNIAPKRAYGSMIEDIDGNIFLDFSASVNAVGYNHPKIISAINEQVTQLLGVSPILTIPFIECAEKLKEILPGELKNGKIAYVTTGSEAIDLGTRIAREYTKRKLIVSFHGTHYGEGTSDCSRLAGDYKPRYKGGLEPLISETLFAPWPYCYRCPLGHTKDDCDLACLSYFDEIFQSFSPNDISAIIFEGLPANSGVLVPPPDYLPSLKSICNENGITMLVDEVFSGFGKTGKILAVENWGIVPDIVCLGKSMGGGLPISTVATRSNVIDQCDFLALGTQGSFSGNAISCVASIATIEVIKEEKLLERASGLGPSILKRLNEISEKNELIGDIRGIGLMFAIELVKDRNTKTPATKEAKIIQNNAYRNGLLISRVGRYGNIIRMTPHLIINDEQIEIGLNILEDALKF
jgi:4-aminobutyrate aminotransferase/(S)-3-amino-2-methylpropionate transaminase